MTYYDSNFNPDKEKDNIIKWIRNFFKDNGPDCNAIVAISGGKDSSVVAGLCVEALGRDRVYGVLLPNGEQADIDASLQLVKHLGIDYNIINIKNSFDEILKEMNTVGIEVTEQTRTNLPARLRMAATYAVAQSKNGRVANTCNLSEDWVGYATRYGDGAGDFSPLSKLTVEEVKAIGMSLGLPENLVYKVPIDGLTPATDEERLGFTYDTLDCYIRTGVCNDPLTKENIDNKHRINQFKLKFMPIYPHKGPELAD